MKARIVLSVAMHHDRLLDSTIAELLVLEIGANVTPMTSVIKGNDEAGTRTRAEAGLTLDVFDFEQSTDILILWKRLRDVLKINCLWLEVFDPYYISEDVANYRGCICDWPVYLAYSEIVGPDLIVGTK